METLELLQEAIAQHVDNPPTPLTPEMNLATIGVDSLTLLELVFTIEEKYKISFPDDIPKPTTVGDLIAVADRLRAGATADAAAGPVESHV